MANFISNSNLRVFEVFAKNYKIYIDTGSFLNIKFNPWLKKMRPLLKKYNNQLIVLPKVQKELELNLGNPDLNIASTTKNILQTINELIGENLLISEKSNLEISLDNYFELFFSEIKTDNVAFITQDYDIFKTIPVNIHTRRINKSSDMSKFRPDDISKIDPRILRTSKQKFKFSKIIISSEDKINNISIIPVENSIIYDNNKNKIKIIDKISEGGEGIIYTTNTEYVAKIYKKESNTKHKFEKLKLMVDTPFDCDGVCYPKSLLYNKEDKSEFVGYLMQKASGNELQKSIFIKPIFEKKYPTWKKPDLVELLVNILHKIVYLHSKNIIIGDINPANILFTSPKEVYFVDTDSYQIGPFPCPVGTINFTAPEIQGKSFGSFLRTMEHENFAVATLCFMIMMTGKTPYSHQGGADPSSNILKKHFPYRFGEYVTDDVPDGVWKFIWSHLPYIVKEGFYNTFSANGRNLKPSSRLNSTEWLDIFKYYLKLFNRGNMQKQDAMSVDIWPTRAKIVNKNNLY